MRSHAFRGAFTQTPDSRGVVCDDHGYTYQLLCRLRRLDNYISPLHCRNARHCQMHDYLASSTTASVRNFACVRQIHFALQIEEGCSSVNFLVEQFRPVGGVMFGMVDIETSGPLNRQVHENYRHCTYQLAITRSSNGKCVSILDPSLTKHVSCGSTCGFMLGAATRLAIANFLAC